jgi:macrolide transport system ATP-binding/permease protein
VEPTKQAYRERSTLPLVENVLRDVRFAVRQLKKNPGFTVTAVLMLALGLCASVSIFAFVDAALIKPLPYANPARLVGVFGKLPLCPRCNLSYLDYLDLKKGNQVFSSFDVWAYGNYLLKTSAGTEPVPGARVSDGFFRTLGVTPILGRDFYVGEDSPGAARAVLLNYSTWKNRFGGRRDIVGQPVSLSDVSYTVVGVLPPEFHFAPRGGAEFWATLHDPTSCEKRRGCHNLSGVARLKDGVSVQTAGANMSATMAQLEKKYPETNHGQAVQTEPLSESIIGTIRPILIVLISGAVLLLLIACVNVSSLLLVRSESRRREIAVRGALGASPTRLAGQFVTEGLLLVVSGNILGLLCAYEVTRLLVHMIPTSMMVGMPYLREVGLNLRVAAFAGVVSLLAIILFSFIPVVRLPFAKMQEGLTDGGRGAAGTMWRRFGANLVVLELAIAVVLLVGAGLLSKSFYRLLEVELGFQPDHLATLLVAAPSANYGKDEQAIALERQVVSRMASLPGAKSAGVTSILPVTCSHCDTTWFRILGHPWNGEHNEIPQRTVSANYFSVLQARLLRGRFFTDGDDASKPHVILINQALAQQYFPGEDPIGRKIGDIDLTTGSLKEIVGIVDDIREGPLDSDVLPTMYYPFNQSADNYFSIVVRTTQDAATVLPTMVAGMHQIDPGIGVSDEATMDQRIQDSQSTYLHRSSAWLVGGFAAVALVLSVVGLYGVIAYSVSQRTREIGVRMALGAQRGAVYRMILREAGWLIAVGVVVGLGCSLAAGAMMRTLLFGVRAWDLPTLGAVAFVLGGSALIASYLPARRAASVNPVDALRAE